MEIGPGIGVAGSRTGSFSWSSWWASRYPSALTLTVNSNVQITLDWTNNGATDYDGVSIERSTDGITYAEIDTAVAGSVTHADATCAADTLYYYRIRYYKGTHYSAYSDPANATTYCTQYGPVFVEFTTKPSVSIAAAQNTMVKKLVADGVWAKFDVFYLFAQTVNSDGEACIDWINPGVRDATLVNGPTFTALEGFAGDGVTQYINSNYNPTTDAVHLSLNNTSAGCYARTFPVEDKAFWGSQFAVNRYLEHFPKVVTNVHLYALNSGQGLYVGNYLPGIYIVNREGAANHELHYNKSRLDTEADISNALPNENLYILAYNVSGTPYSRSTAQLALWYIGASFSDSDRDNFVDAVEAYMDSNGRGVIP